MARALRGWRRGTHAWAYGGATKPLAIGFWLACEMLAAEYGAGRHRPLYPDQRAKVWVFRDRERPINARIDLDLWVRARGGRVKENGEKRSAAKLANQSDWKIWRGYLEEARRKLKNLVRFERFLEELDHLHNLGHPSLVYEKLVVARGLDWLLEQKGVVYAYAGAEAAGRDEHIIAELDLAWVHETARVLSIDAKYLKKSSKKFQNQFRSQQDRLRQLCGPYAYLAYALPVPQGKGTPGYNSPIIPFDAGNAFERAIAAWTRRCLGG